MRGSQKNKNYSIEWTPKLAYAIGLLTTDGNLSKDGRHINFTSNDIELVRTLKKCMSIDDVKIRTKLGGFINKKYSYIQFSNVKLYKWLIEIGLMPNKSKIIGELKIPSRYFFDFLRGHFDGDGCCYSYWDKRWKSSFMFYVVFNSASKIHIDWLRQRIKKLIDINGHICKCERGNLWQLKYAKKESKKIIPKMYYEKDSPCLKRKHEKLEFILKTDKAELLRK